MAALTSSCLPPSGVHRGVSGGPGRNSRPTAASRLERSHWALPRREEPSSHEAEVHACGPALLAACLRTRARQVAASCPGCPGACEAGQGTGVSTLAQGLRAEAWHSDGPGACYRTPCNRARMGWTGPQVLPQSRKAAPHTGQYRMWGPSSGRWLGEGHPCGHRLASVWGVHPGPRPPGKWMVPRDRPLFCGSDEHGGHDA